MTRPLASCQSRTVHDTLDAYRHHRCRCPKARAENTRSAKAYRLRRLAGEQSLVDATGTRRRIQALAANGWHFGALGGRLGGVTTSQVSQYAHPARRNVTVKTAAAVSALYDGLGDRLGPSHYTLVRSRNRGWLPPLWWDDDTIDDPSHVPPLLEQPRRVEPVDPVVVDRLIDDTYNGCATPQERCAALHRLIVSDVPYDEIQRRLGLSGTTMRLYLDRADASGITDDGQAA